MSFIRTSKKNTTRRAFFQDVTAGTAGIAVASALAQLGTPTLAAQYATGTVPPKTPQASSPFFQDPPPWPKGTTGNKYDNLFCTRFKEDSITPVVAGPQA